MLRLKATAGNATGSEIQVEDELVIGRAESGAGALAADVEISRRHAQVTRGADGSYSIEDLGSTNGTLVNGHRISGQQLLYVGDRVEVGATTLVVQVSAPSATVAEQKAPPAQVPEQAEPHVETDLQPPQPQPPPQAEPEPPKVTPAAVPAAPPAALPRLALTLDVDFESGEARLALDGEAQPVRLVHEAGRWRVVPGS